MAGSADRFTVRVDDYERYRPDYPAAAIAEVLAHQPAHVVDVGAGSGQGTSALIERGAWVTAIEPNPSMRAALLARFPTLDIRDGTAEATGLPAAACDLVTMFQAFHWCNGAAALDEFARILRPGGRVAVIWNAPDDRDPFTAAYENLVDTHGDAALAAELPEGSGSAAMFLASPLIEDAEKFVFPHAQTLDRTSFRGRIRSVSYLPPPGPALDAILDEGDRIFDRFAQGAPSLALIYRTIVCIGTIRSAPNQAV